jgi:hypothetical protein
MKRIELSYLKTCSSYLDDPIIWQLDDDIIVDGSHPSQDDILQYTYDFQSYLGSCDAYPFEHSYLLYVFKPPLSSNLEGDNTMVIPEES